MTYIRPLKSSLGRDAIGNKAKSLLFLKKHHFRIPETFVIPGRAYVDYRKDPVPTMQKMEEELMRLPAFEYMVRSSTTLEDSDTFSHAGQFRSVAGLQGKRSLVKAIEELWTTSHLARDVLYSGSTDHFPQELEYAVILQRMIPSVLAGVAFSKNPVNEQHETIVEAVEGPGEELMQKGTTPFRWRFRSRELVDGAEDHPLIHVIREVAGSTRKIKRIHGRDIDLEWVYDGEDIYYVQVRSITVEKDMQVYSNKMAQEMLPGQIKPLVWSVNIPLVNGAWISILSRITGPLEVRPEDLARSFYSRTYFNVAKLGEIFREFGVSMESLENTMLSESSTRHSFRPGLRTLRHTFRIIRFIFYVLRFEKFYLKEYAYLSGWYRDMARKLSMAKIPEEYAALFGELFEKGGRLVHLNILIPLLMRIYNRRLTGKLLKIGIDYNQLRFTDDFPEMEHFSPLPSIRRIREMLESLPPDTREACISPESLKKEAGTQHIRDELDRFLERFGHFSESGNDFSYPKWGEDPELVYRMILNHTEPDRKQKTTGFREIRYNRWLHPGLRAAYRKAGRFRTYREQISSLYIYGYGLFRALFLRLADGFVKDGILKEQGDIFYLNRKEIDELVLHRNSALSESCISLVSERKQSMEDSRDLILPAVIYGEVAPILDRKNLRNFRGTGTSPGQYTGKVKVVRQAGDFDKVEPGDVVIIPFSDVSWTPVLCRSGAIVAESGGMLSHCSIIARELGLPSMVSVDNACALPDNILVTVDGSNGILTVHDHE